MVTAETGAGSGGGSGGLGSSSSSTSVITSPSDTSQQDATDDKWVLKMVTAETGAEGGTMVSDIHRLINIVWNTNELPQHWKQSVSVPIYRKGDNKDCGNYRGTITVINYKISSNIILSTLTSYAYEIIGIIRVDFVVTDQMGRHSACAISTLLDRWNTK